jgi:selenocysteine-specific elongation factor
LARGVELTVLADALRVDTERARAVVESVDSLVIDRGLVRDASRRVPVADTPDALALVAILDATPFTPPAPADVALARALVREGVLVDVNGLVFTREALSAAQRLLADALDAHGSVTVGDVRELLGSTRKYVVPLMEWFDAQGVTRRRGDTRVAGPRLRPGDNT